MFDLPDPVSYRFSLVSAHMQPKQAYSNGSSSTHPLEGLIPRAVGLGKIHEIMNGDINPFRGDGKQPFSANYRKILQQRKGLPVYQKMEEFYDVASLPSTVEMNEWSVNLDLDCNCFSVQQEPNCRYGRSNWIWEDHSNSSVCLLCRSTTAKGKDGRLHATQKGGCHECSQASGGRDGW
jgi:hypothetical protein